MSARTILFGLLLLPIGVSTADAAGLLVPRTNAPPIEVQSHRVEAELVDGLARTTLRQTFVNPTDRAFEAIYTFPLPENSALVAVAMETGGKRFEGLLAERQRARRIYDEIVRGRRDPALVEEVGRNLFQLSVFPVLPKVETVVELTWIERVPLANGQLRYVYPLATGDRAAATKQDLTFSLRVRSTIPLVKVASSNDGMEVVRKGEGEALASYERMRARLDRDIVVTADVRVEEPTLTVRTFRGKKGDGWFMAVVTPPEARENQLIPRDVILLVDTSGSMRGRKIEQARASALYLLDHLRAADRVNVIRFSSASAPFAEGPVPATPANLAMLRGFVKAFRAEGSTALGDALRDALAVPGAEGRVRTVVLLTDGLPTIGETDPAKIVGFAREGGARGLRVFAFGVGRDLNPALLEGISSASRGRAEIFRPEQEIEGRLKRFLHRTSSPVIANIALSVDGVPAYDLYPRPVPDAYLGEQVILCGRYRDGGEGTVTVSGLLGGKRAKISRIVEFPSEPSGSPTVAWLFARRKLDFLEGAMRLRMGLSDDAYYAALQRGAYSTKDEIVEEIITLSLEHGVQSAFTSFLVLLPEDRQRIDPRNMEELTAALDRARKARTALSPDGTAPGIGSEFTESEEDRRRRSISTKTSAHFFGNPGARTAARRDPTDPRPPAEGPAPGGGVVPPSTGAATPGGPMPISPRAKPIVDRVFWWAHERAPMLLLPAPEREPVSDDAVWHEIIPALKQVITNRDMHFALRRAAIVSLARCGRTAEDADSIVKVAADETTEAKVRETAVLALGIAHFSMRSMRDDVLENLARIVRDATHSHRLRCSAALSLGLMRDRSSRAFKALSVPIQSSASHRDLKACAFTAVGLIGDPSRVREMITWLGRRMGDNRLSDLERVHLITALGRIRSERALLPVLGVLREKGTLSRRAAYDALGRLIPTAKPRRQVHAVSVLIAALEGEADVSTRGIGLVALGRAAAGRPSDTDLFRKCEAHLLKAVGRGSHVNERPWAAVGLGMIARRLPPVESKRKERLTKAMLMEAWKLRGEPASLGALCITLGLLGDDGKEVVDLLTKILDDPKWESRLRASALVALGLLKHAPTTERLTKLVTEPSDRNLRAAAATTLSLLETGGGPAALLGMMNDPRASQVTVQSAAAALGRLGDERAVPSLTKILQPDKANGIYPLITRACAADALGGIADPEGTDPLWRLGERTDFSAYTSTLERILLLAGVKYDF